jgi:hypothetical protein
MIGAQWNDGWHRRWAVAEAGAGACPVSQGEAADPGRAYLVDRPGAQARIVATLESQPREWTQILISRRLATSSARTVSASCKVARSPSSVRTPPSSPAAAPTPPFSRSRGAVFGRERRRRTTTCWCDCTANLTSLRRGCCPDRLNGAQIRHAHKKHGRQPLCGEAEYQLLDRSMAGYVNRSHSMLPL